MKCYVLKLEKGSITKGWIKKELEKDDLLKKGINE